jgi:5-hydroxyisourate hydrolase-like protein (transthyretin family)
MCKINPNKEKMINTINLNETAIIEKMYSKDPDKENYQVLIMGISFPWLQNTKKYEPGLYDSVSLSFQVRKNKEIGNYVVPIDIVAAKRDNKTFPAVKNKEKEKEMAIA